MAGTKWTLPLKYTDSLGKRKILYSWRLTEADKMPEGKRADLSLREKERKVQSLQMQGIQEVTLQCLNLWNDIFP